MATSEQAFIAAPIASGGGRVIASPFQFYTTGEDNLRVTSVNSLTGVALKIQARFLDAAGGIQAYAWDHHPNADRTTRTEDFPLGVGAVLNLTVFASSGTPQIGQTFVVVQLVRGIGAGAIALGTLLQGYVTSTQNLGWPGSPIQSSIEGPGALRTITGTKPTAGHNITETVPTGARWELLSVYAILTASSTGVDRIPVLYVNPGGTVAVLSLIPGFVGASQVFALAWGKAMLGSSTGDATNASGSAPADLPLKGGSSFNVDAFHFLSTDQWSAPNYAVREWLEVQ